MMVLLTGFNNSALFAVFLIYLIISLVVFVLVMALLSNFNFWKLFLQRQKARSRYLWTLLLLYVAIFSLVTGIIYVRYHLLNLGFLE